MTIVEAFQIEIALMKFRTKTVEVVFYHRPTSFEKGTVEAVGARARSGGISLTTASISCVVKGVVRLSKSTLSHSIWERLNFICGGFVFPKRALNASNKIDSFPAWSSTTMSSLIFKLEMKFLRYRSVATAWKNLEFSSPNLIQRIVHHFFQ